MGYGDESVQAEPWEGHDGGAEFCVSRTIYRALEGRELISLVVTGQLIERARLADEFFSALGRPAAWDLNFPGDRSREWYTWMRPRETESE